MRLRQLVLWLLCSIMPIAGHCTEQHYTVEQILTFKTAPSGVIFEIVSNKKDSLQWALPLVKNDIARLRSRFPTLDIAVVSHGDEQFALQKSKSVQNPEIHSLTRDMVKAGVPVHVCGAYAEYKGVSEEDFPEHVNVAAHGPSQIKDYIAVGYLHVKITARNRPAAGR